MKVMGYLALFLMLALPARAQEVFTYGALVTKDIAGGESHTYSLVAGAGDLISGPAEFAGVEGFVQFLDGTGGGIAGMRLQRGFFVGGPMARRVGFVAPVSGTYQVRLAASGASRGTYKLRLDRLPVAARMQGVSITPKEVRTSERIRRLSRDVEQGGADTVRQFWAEMAGRGPLVESIAGNAEDVLVTFLWRETFETHHVLVGWPMAQGPANEYYMTRLPNTDVWHKTIQIRRGSLFSYWLSPNDRPGDFLFTAQLDPLNPRVFPDDPSATQDRNSVFRMPDSPDDGWYVRRPANQGTVTESKFASEVLKNERGFWVYTPPGYSAAAGPYPLLVLFDGFVYRSPAWINAPATLDGLITSGRIRPVVVCFLDSVNRAVDLGFSGADAFGDAIVRELLPQLRSTYAISATPSDVVIGGSSMGGLAASLIALRHPGAFGNVLSQSGAFRQQAVGSAEPNTVAQRYAVSAKVPVRFYLETGIYDNFPSAGLPLHEMALDEGTTVGNRHFRDVLVAKGYDVVYRETGTAHEHVHWRATLADGLMTLFKPIKR